MRKYGRKPHCRGRFSVTTHAAPHSRDWLGWRVFCIRDFFVFFLLLLHLLSLAVRKGGILAFEILMILDHPSLFLFLAVVISCPLGASSVKLKLNLPYWLFLVQMGNWKVLAQKGVGKVVFVWRGTLQAFLFQLVYSIITNSPVTIHSLPMLYVALVL